MSYSFRLKGFFLGCVVGFALATRLAFLPLSLFESMGGLADFANEFSILIALLAASRLTQRLKSSYAKRTVLHLLEQSWLNWTAQLAEQKSAAAKPSGATFKMVA